MFASCQLIFIAVIGLLPESLSPVEAICRENVQTNPYHCVKALQRIIYDEEGHLPTTETSVKVMYKSCLILVDNPTRAFVTEEKIVNLAVNIFQQCSKSAGRLQLPDDASIGVEIMQPAPPGSQLEAYNPDFELHRPSCHEVKVRVKIVQADCIKAYESLSTDPQGNISARNNLGTASVGATYKSCSLNIMTTDGSKIRMRKEDAETFFKTMVQKCDGKWGYINMIGAEGPNGRTIMHTFSDALPPRRMLA
ncbi:hypothetical protein PSHT_03157 [Puccinia striiformis]|uniref:Uncharacterized protein n=1 Tax=Puccinia striiformis TaxID=27350 RepID=A0A2S4WGA4_9BASI|nr:hypothetical protein PSHT_03157 [Puccinia striiformis]